MLDFLFLLCAVLAVLLYRLLERREDEADRLFDLFVDTVFAIAYLDEAYGTSVGDDSLRPVLQKYWRDWGLERAFGALPSPILDRAVKSYELGVKKRREHELFRGDWEQPSLINAYEKMLGSNKLKIMRETGIVKVVGDKTIYITGGVTNE